MEQPPQQTEKDKQADETERQRYGLDQQEWDTAFEWADGEWVESDAGTAAPGAATDAGGGGPFVVLAGNWETFQTFLACRTQWRRNFSGSFGGLNYTGVDVVLKRRKLTDPDRTFAEIQAMELAALEVLNG